MFKKKKKQEENNELEFKDLNINDDSSEDKKVENKTFGIYKLLFYILVAALLLAFGILLLVKRKESVFIIFITTASVVILVSIIRLFYILLKKETNPKVKKSTLIISLVFLGVGIYMIIAGAVYNNDIKEGDMSDFSLFNDKYFPVFVAALLYAESIVYFMNTVLFKKDSKKFNFWLHIAFITIAVIILSFASGRKNDGNDGTATSLVIAIAVISFICSAISVGIAFVGYNGPNGSGKKKKIEAPKEDNVDDEDDEELHLPSNDDDNNNQPVVM